jgi:hypothetical protein
MEKLEMEDFDQALPDHLALAVVMEKEPSSHPWADYRYDAIGVLVREEDEDSTVSRIYKDGDTEHYLVTGLTLRLHPDECESYYHNLMSPEPGCFIVAGQSEDSDDMPLPYLVSLSFDEVHAYLEGDEQIYSVEIPARLYQELECRRQTRERRRRQVEVTVSKPPKADESVLSRWSRRKLEVEQARSEPQSPPAIVPEPTQAVDAVPVEDEAPPLTDADMPDIETLTEESDFSVFMSPGVTDELRNLALRKLFHAPVFNIRDGLDEYDEDFTTFEKLGDIVTADMKHQVEMQQKKLREKLAQEEEAARTEAVDEARASDYTDESGEDVEDDFDDDPEPAQAAVEADAPANRTDTST